MWRWPTVAGQKEASAKAKSKIYGIHSKLISIAAEKGADPTINVSLYDAIASAKKEWVTADVIDRAIRRWAWLDKDSKKVEEIFYEGYGAWGVWVIVRALTDNRNRTAPSMRHIFSAFWGNMGETGSVSSFLFDYVGIIIFDREGIDIDAFEEVILETAAQDYTIESDMIEVITDRTDLIETRKILETKWFQSKTASIGYRAKNFIDITDFDTALKIYTLLEGFHDDEDVETVWNNANISDSLWKEVEVFVESKRFRT
jgi:YebC/PmpR family DNA-binding regulatory protein